MSTTSPNPELADDGRTAVTSTGMQSPVATKRLLPSIAVLSVFVFATYAGVIGILLPAQVAQIDPDPVAKVANFGLVSSISFVFTLFAQPVVGAFSDRTRNRLGRRAPWMLIGASVAMIFLLGMGGMQNILWVTVFWVVIQVSMNAVQGPLSAVVPDRFPRSKRGVASAMAGVGMMLGSVVGTVVAAQFVANIGIGYAVFGIGVLVVTALYVVVNKDYPSGGAVVEPWSWAAFLKGFWINPKRNPDFFWAFTARFLFILGYFVIAAYNLYLLQDYIGMELETAAASAATLAMAGLLPTIISIALAGWWSDKIGRRKVFIYAATVIMIIGLAFPLLMPTFEGMLIMNIINGFGFGLYMACDTALMTEVLPGGGTAAGKDLGILNVATNIPQALSPAVAGFIILALGGYSALFVFAMIAVVAAALALIPIKGVR
ncbi:MFS transporter [Microterricola viridarii]|uniref:Na+/melibiose symporter n=1 Tax=Microterricola viridarii TaxID=412690 RepID=A0A1H1LHA3_9MICO|nr:MFS transporter [Microterricola viridarii]SDR73702.1 Na+/melibiose symporter [Microterricola viridarii]